MTSRISPRTGRTRKRSARPRLSLTDRLANLHLLLRSNSFARWPLKLTFYSEDVYRVWQKWSSQTPEKLRAGIEVPTDETVPKADDQNIPANTTGIHALDVGYMSLKSQLEKSQAAFEGEINCKCTICRKAVPTSGAATLVCTNNSCSAVAHLHCLSSVFLRDEKQNDTLVPTHGKCPSCNTELQWIDLVKDLSLRMRGEKEVKAIFKPKRGKKAIATAAAEVDLDESADEDGPLDLVLEDDEWQRLSESSDDEAEEDNARSNPSAAYKRQATGASSREPVIEDSDWDEAELLT